MIRALSSRESYSQEALDLYKKVLMKNIQPNEVIFQYSLYACGKLGNVKMAYEILSQMKGLGFPMKSVHVYGVLETYATAVAKDFVPEHLVKLYVQDGWDMFNKALALDTQRNLESPGKDKLVTAQVINSLLLLHVRALKVKDAEELVLPLYTQLGMEFNAVTYQVIFTFYYIFYE
jgi:pentatricopeptide repeat protein